MSKQDIIDTLRNLANIIEREHYVVGDMQLAFDRNAMEIQCRSEEYKRFEPDSVVAMRASVYVKYIPRKPS